MASAPSGIPLRVKLHANDKRLWDKLKADKVLIEKLRADVKASEFFDAASPPVRELRGRVRARFENYIEDVYDVLDIKDIWNSETITDRTREWLGGFAASQRGKLGPKIKASSLWLAKQSIYWWAVRFIPDFSTVYHPWHSKTSAHIHYIAVKEGLSTAFYEKNNLTDTELALIFQYVMRQQYGVANFKQHYIAMLLAWTTSARPGTFSVSKLYHKGASLGIEGHVREEAQTLYWRDVEFRRLEDGTIAVRVTLRYHKGLRDPHAQHHHYDPSKTFTFLPTLGTRFEFDLSLLLLGLAWNRGLFPEYNSLVEILEGDEVFIRTCPNVSQQAVFVQATRAGGIDVTQPMRVNSLNDKLQSICTSIGLLGRNTYYGFRRTALIETGRKDGIDAAKKLANHAASTDSVNLNYDNEALADLDITAHRLDIDEKMTRAQIRHWHGQSQLLYNVEDSEGFVDLREILKRRVDEEKREDPQYIEVEMGLAMILQDIKTKMLEMITSGLIPADADIPAVYGAKACSRYRQAATIYQLDDHLATLEDFLKHRKTVHKSVRTRLVNEIKQKMQEEQKKTLKINKSKASRTIPGKGYQPKVLGNASKSVLSSFDRTTEEAIGSLEIDSPTEDEHEDDLDQDAIDQHEAQEGGRSEPACWEALADEVHVRVDRSDDNEEQSPKDTHQNQRTEFLKNWAEKADFPMPNAGLRCSMCLADPTQTQKAKTTVYGLKKLNMHLRSGTHSRRSQLMRAIGLEIKAQVKGTMLRCPICQGVPRGGVGNISTKMISHIEDVHPEELWEDETSLADERGENKEVMTVPSSSRASSRRSRVVIDSEDDDDDDDAEFIPERSPLHYKGKGKAAIRD